MSRRKTTKQEKEYKTLLSAIANGSTDSARDLLIKHTGTDALNPKDLEEKLSLAYKNSNYKIDFEKDLAEIHPHKDFILKYNNPIEIIKPISESHDGLEKIISEGKVLTTDDVRTESYNADGTHPPCGNPSCKKCSRYFNYNGNEQNTNYKNEQQSIIQNNNSLMVVGIISIVGIVSLGMFSYMKSIQK